MKHTMDLILVIVAVFLLLLTAAVLVLRYGKSRVTDISARTQPVVLEIEEDTLPDRDSIVRLFGIDPGKVVFKRRDGRNIICLPVKKILTVRYYDNVFTLSKLYNTPAELIMRVNCLKDTRIEPGTEIIIP